MVKILEAASASLKQHGAPVSFARPREAFPASNQGISGNWRVRNWRRYERPRRLQADFARCKTGSRGEDFGFVNLYGCEIGDETRIGTFVEIQKGARIGIVARSPATPSFARA